MLPGWQFVSREVIMNENNRSERWGGERYSEQQREGVRNKVLSKSTVQRKDKIIKKNCTSKKRRRQTAEEGRGKQRMQMRGESITEMIAAITIIISMCCCQ